MASWKAVERSFAMILAKIGDPEIRLVTRGEWKQIVGHGMGNYVGKVEPKLRVVVVLYRGRGIREIRNTLWHEVAHVLFPKRPHWWIECFAWKMCPVEHLGCYSRRYCHSPVELPSKAKLLELARRAGQNIKSKSGGLE